MQDKIDRYWVGIVLGIILPAVFLYVYIMQFNLWQSLVTFRLEMSESICKMLLLSMFPNLAGMFVCYAAEVWKISKGLLIGTFPYLLICLAVTML